MKKVNKKLPKAQTGIISKIAKAAKNIKPTPKPKPTPKSFGESGQYGRKIDFIMSQQKMILKF